jgi:hypothetical protein
MQSRSPQIEDVAALSEDIDQIAIVVDWLDACRARDLDALAEVYASDARLECECSGAIVCEGRAALRDYWAPRLDALAPTAFGLEEITPTADGVTLDYRSFEGKPVRVFFAFATDGKIQRMRCGPIGGAVG